MQIFIALLEFSEGNLPTMPALFYFRSMMCSFMLTLMYSLMLTWTRCWTNRRVAGDLRRHDAHVTSLQCHEICTLWFVFYGHPSKTTSTVPTTPYHNNAQTVCILWVNLTTPRANSDDNCVNLQTTFPFNSVFCSTFYFDRCWSSMLGRSLSKNKWRTTERRNWSPSSMPTTSTPSALCAGSFHHISWVYETRFHHDVIIWLRFPHYWPLLRGIHRSPMDSPHKGPIIWTFNVSFFTSKCINFNKVLESLLLRCKANVLRTLR